MKRQFTALAVLACAASANAADELETRITSMDGWVAYHVPMVAGEGGPCCFAIHGNAASRRGCDLDERSWSFGNSDDDPAGSPDDTLAVYLRVEHGRIDRVRAVGTSCPVQTASTVRWIDPVDPANSIAMLSSLRDDHSLAALAYHAGEAATRAIAARAEPSHTRKEREQAIFWLGQTRGAEGADIVERYATTDANPKLRAHAIFALSQSKAPDAYPHILAMAHRDPAEHVRGQALFWLAQMDDARAKDDIVASLKSESSGEVREQAVFALSRLDNGAADDALIAVLHGDYSREVKKRAFFWLAQSGSPRAIEYFDRALK